LGIARCLAEAVRVKRPVRATFSWLVVAALDPKVRR
jgi:hypothetical protein